MALIKEIAFLIPAHNEEKVIAHTIESLLLLAPPEDIYVVSDGSWDATASIARRYTDNVLELKMARGKATAINLLIKEYNVVHEYKYIMPMDADTVVSGNFLHKSLPLLEEDNNELIACVVGKVTGRGHNWITLYRLWEYEIAQSIHKQAQSHENAVTICPGCSTVYRSRVFEFTEIPTGTLTEDMDLTFLLHRRNVGKILYVPDAVVITQDPGSFKDYMKQIHRWYTGFWQCILKHNIPWEGQVLDLEVSMLALEGLFNGLLIVSMAILVPMVIMRNPGILFIPFVIDFCFFLIPTMLFVSVTHRSLRMLLFIPHFYLMRVMSSLVLLLTFFKVVLAYDLRASWGKIRRY